VNEPALCSQDAHKRPRQSTVSNGKGAGQTPFGAAELHPPHRPAKLEVAGSSPVRTASVSAGQRPVARSSGLANIFLVRTESAGIRALEDCAVSSSRSARASKSSSNRSRIHVQPHERRTDSGGVDEQMAHGCGPRSWPRRGSAGSRAGSRWRVRRGRPARALQVHHGDRGEGLGYGADPRHRVSVMGVFDVMSASP
jgi:hypothetical protein